MNNYVPMAVWTQWAQERGEWRGSVDTKLQALKEEQTKLKTELLNQYSGLDKKQDIQNALLNAKMDTLTSILTELKDTLRSHTQKP